MQGDGSVSAAEGEGGAGRRLQFSDKDEHMYFWFPLLAGLSELTFDPRPGHPLLRAGGAFRLSLCMSLRCFQSWPCARIVVL